MGTCWNTFSSTNTFTVCVGTAEDHYGGCGRGAVVQRDTSGVQELRAAVHGGLLQWQHFPQDSQRFVPDQHGADTFVLFWGGGDGCYVCETTEVQQNCVQKTVTISLNLLASNRLC